ncbi:response regulator [candidate division FCPU426 bacterium]|nr:response regulator [candidate division FCPU426 bacterium]
MEPMDKAAVINQSSKQSNQQVFSPRLLIVDDDRNMLDILKTVMTDHFTVKTSTHGKEALGIAVSFLPDVILTDYQMPGLNGLELIAHMKTMEIRSRFIIYTAAADAELRKNARLLGVECVTKPFDLKALTDKLLALGKQGARI